MPVTSPSLQTPFLTGPGQTVAIPTGPSTGADLITMAPVMKDFYFDKEDQQIPQPRQNFMRLLSSG